MSKILVIKLGALGDIIISTGAFKAIRAKHAGDHITLLTSPAYAELMRNTGYFDDIMIDTRPRLYNPFAFFGLIEKIRRAKFARVYDLQCSERTAWYHWLLCKPRPEWVGSAKGASHPHHIDPQQKLHALERQRIQLSSAGIETLPPPDVTFLASDISRFHLKQPYALIVAGCSAKRVGKRWPASQYALVCQWLVTQGITPVLIGTKDETPVLSIIQALCPEAQSLQGETRFADIASLARSAIVAVGNDTGPMHLVAYTNCPSVVLFSAFSDPALCAPRAQNVHVIREASMASIKPETVIMTLKKILTTFQI